MKRISTVPFQGTELQEAELKRWLATYKETPGAAMGALQKGQEIYGYLPLEVQRMIADELDIPLAEVYGISTFYSQFSLFPKGEYEVGVCMGTACYVRGSGKIFEEFEKQLSIKDGETTGDGKFGLKSTRCIGACGLAPVITVNDDVYGRLAGTTDEIQKIISKY